MALENDIVKAYLAAMRPCGHVGSYRGNPGARYSAELDETRSVGVICQGIAFPGIEDKGTVVARFTLDDQDRPLFQSV